MSKKNPLLLLPWEWGNWRAAGAGVLKKSYLERDKGYRCYEMILIVSDEERGVSIPGVLNWSTQSPPLSVGLCCELWRVQAINYKEARYVKYHWFVWRANQWPLVGETLFSSFPRSNSLPRLCLGPLKGFLSWHGALQGPSTCLVLWFRNYRKTRTLMSK